MLTLHLTQISQFELFPSVSKVYNNGFSVDLNVQVYIQTNITQKYLFLAIFRLEHDYIFVLFLYAVLRRAPGMTSQS